MAFYKAGDFSLAFSSDSQMQATACEACQERAKAIHPSHSSHDEK